MNQCVFCDKHQPCEGICPACLAEQKQCEAEQRVAAGRLSDKLQRLAEACDMVARDVRAGEADRGRAILRDHQDHRLHALVVGREELAVILDTSWQMDDVVALVNVPEMAGAAP